MTDCHHHAEQLKLTLEEGMLTWFLGTASPMVVAAAVANSRQGSWLLVGRGVLLPGKGVIQLELLGKGARNLTLDMAKRLAGSTHLVVDSALAYLLIVKWGMAFLDRTVAPLHLVEVADQGVGLSWQRQGGHLQILSKESESAHTGQTRAERRISSTV